MFRNQFAFIIVFVLMHSFPALGQQDSTQILQISSTTVESVSLLNSDFTSLSLIDSVLYNDFEKGVKAYKNPETSVLVTVTKGESEQRMEFIGLFYKDWLGTNDISKAYKSALSEIRKKYPHPDFKSKLFVKKKE